MSDKTTFGVADALLELHCGHRAEDRERLRYGPDAWCHICQRWVERNGWPEP